MREGVLDSLLSADVVAFHTQGYARSLRRHLRSSASSTTRRGGKIIYRDGREVWVRAYPISIDPAEFEELAESDAVLEQEGFVKDLPGKLPVAGRSHRPLQEQCLRLSGLRRMLERHPEMAGEVTLPRSSAPAPRAPMSRSTPPTWRPWRGRRRR